MTAKDCRFLARESLRGNWKSAVFTAFIANLLGGMVHSTLTFTSIDLTVPPQAISGLPSQFRVILYTVLTIIMVSTLVQLLIGGAVELGHCTYLLRQYDRKPAGTKNLFSRFGLLSEAFILRIYTGFKIILWSFLFVIPGIVASYSYAMAPFILAEHPEYSVRQAVDKSKEMMTGNRSELFWLEITFIGWEFLCVLTPGIGFLFLNPYKAAARAAFYRNIK